MRINKNYRNVVKDLFFIATKLIPKFIFMSLVIINDAINIRSLNE